MKNFFVLCFSALLLQGCLSNSTRLSDDAIFLKTAPVCDSEELCARMWEEAGNWVRKYSPQGIRVYNENLIRSVERDPSSFELEIEVKKTPAGEGKFKILIDIYCNEALSSCNIERNNMIAFNKKLSAMLPPKQQAVVAQAFDASSELEDWLKLYDGALSSNNSSAIAALYHFPVTIVDADKVIVLQTSADLQQYQSGIKAQQDRRGVIYTRLGGHKVIDKLSHSAYMTVVMSAYNNENVRVFSRQMNLQLVASGNSWQLMTIVLSD